MLSIFLACIAKINGDFFDETNSNLMGHLKHLRFMPIIELNTLYIKSNNALLTKILHGCLKIEVINF